MKQKKNDFASIAFHDASLLLSVLFVILGIIGTFCVGKYFPDLNETLRTLLLLFFGMVAMESGVMFSRRLQQLKEE
ncbi:MAG: hypothetical protein LUE24_11375 [Lachnospiraceae bacterium]|nr:hypothetical protein [Lachnospiraceae bacterium]